MRRGTSALAHMLQNFPLLQNRTRQFPARSPGSGTFVSCLRLFSWPRISKGVAGGCHAKTDCRDCRYCSGDRAVERGDGPRRRPRRRRPWGGPRGGPFPWGRPRASPGAFRECGCPDIYAGMFAAYGYDDLTGYYSPRRSSRHRNRALDRLAQMCGDDSPEIAGLPIDQIQQVIELTEPQLAALDDLANASISAAQKIRAACPTQMVLTAPGRLAAMQARIEAMISAVATVQPPLEKFYGLLNDEQKART